MDILTTTECNSNNASGTYVKSPIAIKRQQKKDQIKSYRRKYESSKKKEIETLRQKVAELDILVKDLQEFKEMQNVLSSPWEVEARNQRLLRERATLENLHLRQALQAQVQVAQLLQKTIVRNATVKIFPCLDGETEWQFFHLVDNPHKRWQAMEAILDREYCKLATVLLHTGLYDSSEKCDLIRISSKENEILEVEQVRCSSYQGARNPEVVGKIVFDCMSGNIFEAFPADDFFISIKKLESFGENVSYCEYLSNAALSMNSNGQHLAMRIVIKQYVEKNRVVIAWHSISRDEIFPLDTNNIIFPQVAWLVVEKTENGCSMKFVIRYNPPLHIFHFLKTMSSQPEMEAMFLGELKNNSSLFTEAIEEVVNRSYQKM